MESTKNKTLSIVRKSCIAVCAMLTLLASPWDVSPAQAGCGDYMLFNGRPALWHTAHGAKQSTNLITLEAAPFGTETPTAESVLVMTWPRHFSKGPAAPCQGPNCRGQMPPRPTPAPPTPTTVRSMEVIVAEVIHGAKVTDESSRITMPADVMGPVPVPHRLERPPRG